MKKEERNIIRAMAVMTMICIIFLYAYTSDKKHDTIREMEYQQTIADQQHEIESIKAEHDEIQKDYEKLEQDFSKLEENYQELQILLQKDKRINQIYELEKKGEYQGIPLVYFKESNYPFYLFMSDNKDHAISFPMKIAYNSDLPVKLCFGIDRDENYKVDVIYSSGEKSKFEGIDNWFEVLLKEEKCILKIETANNIWYWGIEYHRK